MGGVFLKKCVTLLVLLATTLTIAAPLDGILERYQRSYFEGRRFIIDLNSGSTVRYEQVIKEKNDKLVTVISPERVVWLRFQEKYYIQKNSELLELTFPIYDLEDYLVDVLKRENYQLLAQKRDGSEDVYVLKSGVQVFTIWIGEDGFIDKIVRELPPGYRTALIYEYHEIKGLGETVRRYWLQHPVVGRITSNLSPVLRKIPKYFAWSNLRFFETKGGNIPIIYGITNEGYKVTIIDLDGLNDSVVTQILQRFSEKEFSFYVKKNQDGSKFLFVGDTSSEYLVKLATVIFEESGEGG